jgi:hypothetical protein
LKEQGCEGDTRDGDVLLQGWAKGKNVAVDFVIEHPLAPHRWPLRLERVQRCLKDAEVAKQTKGEERCARHGWGFQPAAFTTWGMAGPQASAMLFEIKKRATNNLSGWIKIKKAEEITANISLTMARQIARQLRMRNRVHEMCTTNEQD